MSPLKLVAFDQDDLEVLSAHLQDALVCTGDIRWRPSEKRLVVGLCRFDWEAVHTAEPEFRRRSAALRFERVLSCKALNVEKAAKDRMLNLLSVSFTENDRPAGTVMLTFSGGAALRLEVECVEAALSDLGEVWTTSCCPDHSEAVAKQG